MPDPLPLLLPDPSPFELQPRRVVGDLRRALEAHLLAALPLPLSLQELLGAEWPAGVQLALAALRRPEVSTLDGWGLDAAARQQRARALAEAARRLDAVARQLARGTPLDTGHWATLEQGLVQAGLLPPEEWGLRPSGLVVPRRGRPRGTGTWQNADHFLATVGPVVAQLRRAGRNPTAAAVRRQLAHHLGTIDPATFTRWYQGLGWPSWAAVLAAAERAGFLIN